MLVFVTGKLEKHYNKKVPNIGTLPEHSSHLSRQVSCCNINEPTESGDHSTSVTERFQGEGVFLGNPRDSGREDWGTLGKPLPLEPPPLTTLQVVPGRAGGGSFRRKKNYIAKKEFAYRMCAGRPTSAMPKPFLCCERAFC